MATPIRMAPVLIGQEAEEFYDRWEQSLKVPDTSAPTKEEYQEIVAFIKKYNMR